MPRKLLPSFASVNDLQRRVQEPIESVEDIALAESLLATVSAQIRAVGDAWPNPVLAPDICWAVCVQAAARGYQNPAGYELERGDMQTIQRGKTAAAGEDLLKNEILAIQRVSESGLSFWTLQIVRDVIVSDKQIVGDDNASVSLS